MIALNDSFSLILLHDDVTSHSVSLNQRTHISNRFLMKILINTYSLFKMFMSKTFKILEKVVLCYSHAIFRFAHHI